MTESNASTDSSVIGGRVPAGELVAEDVAGRRKPELDGVHIGPAQPARLDGDHDLVGRRHRVVDVGHLHAARHAHDGLHPSGP
jgi:hypothetical protein